jgi:hypothetical protein
MDPIYSIIGIIAIVVVITLWLLPIILFFKVWGMCNDVKRIKEMMERKELNNSVRSV